MATAAAAFAQIANECEREGLTPQNSERIGQEIAKSFNLQPDEVGILKLEKQTLIFVYPAKLHMVGSIPLNTSGSVASRTATSKRRTIAAPMPFVPPVTRTRLPLNSSPKTVNR